MKQRLSPTFTLGDSVRGTNMVDINREAYILTNLKHENIVKLHEVFYCDDSVVLILDLVTGGELFARVAECERLSEEEASNFVEQILLGVQHMHSLGVVHLDLKPENIMIEDLASRKIKIIDFGLARALNPNETFQDMAGTPEFCAPEVVSYDPITFATDMWAIGVITYILLTGISPFAGDSQIETFQNILDCLVDYNREEICGATQLAKDFIRHLLVKNPTKRYTVKQCLQHPWIKPLDNAQKINRRDSVIRKQNLDGLRQFIAYPSPPSSPTGLMENCNNRSANFFGENSPNMDGTISENSELNKSQLVNDHTPVIVRTMITKTREKHSDKENMKLDELPLTRTEPNDTVLGHTGNRASVVSIEMEPSRITQKETKAQSVLSADDGRREANNLKSVGSRSNNLTRKGNVGSSLIERLGAAFSSAANVSSLGSHSTKANKHDSKQYHNQSNGPNGNLPKEAVPLLTEKSKKTFRRGLQLGTVTRAAREFENTATTFMEPIREENGDQIMVESGIRLKQTGKSHSISHTTDLKIWNSHKNENTKQPPRHPNRVHVGRLQELFESHSGTHGRQRNGTFFSHRNSQT